MDLTKENIINILPELIDNSDIEIGDNDIFIFTMREDFYEEYKERVEGCVEIFRPGTNVLGSNPNYGNAIGPVTYNGVKHMASIFFSTPDRFESLEVIPVRLSDVV